MCFVVKFYLNNSHLCAMLFKILFHLGKDVPDQWVFFTRRFKGIGQELTCFPNSDMKRAFENHNYASYKCESEFLTLLRHASINFNEFLYRHTCDPGWRRLRAIAERRASCFEKKLVYNFLPIRNSRCFFFIYNLMVLRILSSVQHKNYKPTRN